MAKGQSCPTVWSQSFPGDGQIDGAINALTPYGNELYIGGVFPDCMNRPSYYVARWDAYRWAIVGRGPWIDPVGENPVYALAVFDQGGSRIFAGALDGIYSMPDEPGDPNAPWTRVGATNGSVRGLAIYGGVLYAAGEFTCIRAPDPNDPNAPCDPNTPGHVAGPIACWDGQSWSAVGLGVAADPNDPNSPVPKVLALTVFNDGGGDALFVGGTFLTAGGTPANRVARWRIADPNTPNGVWSALGGGITDGDPNDPNDLTWEVDALAGWPAAGKLYVGGRFDRAGGVPVRGVAAAVRDSNDVWTWSGLAGGLGDTGPGPGGPKPGAALCLGRYSTRAWASPCTSAARL